MAKRSMLNRRNHNKSVSLRKKYIPLHLLMPPMSMVFYTAILLLVYSLLFYFIIKQQLSLDFAAFYGSLLACTQHINPYSDLQSTFLTTSIPLQFNLNPPIFLLLFSFLTYFSYTTASIIWGIGSLVLGSLGALICFYLTSITEFFKNNYYKFILLYLALYSTLVNSVYNQISGFLLFFIMTGYYFYLRKKDYIAGLLWGLIIAIKLFPGLILIFMLSQKRYKVFAITLLSLLVLLSLPLFVWGEGVYSAYFKIVQQVIWYGNSWNASLYGFLFRLFIDMDSHHDLFLIKSSYLIISLMVFAGYVTMLQTINKVNTTHAAFSLTLIVMLLLSPLGWMYYFGLLLLPFIVIYQMLSQSEMNKTGLWTFCLFALSAPIEHIQTRYVVHALYKSTLYSIYFYGLSALICLLIYGINTKPQIHAMNEVAPSSYMLPLQLILGLDLLIMLFTLIGHL